LSCLFSRTGSHFPFLMRVAEAAAGCGCDLWAPEKREAGAAEAVSRTAVGLLSGQAIQPVMGRSCRPFEVDGTRWRRLAIQRGVSPEPLFNTIQIKLQVQFGGAAAAAVGRESEGRTHARRSRFSSGRKEFPAKSANCISDPDC
jgi:hypothetical protein